MMFVGYPDKHSADTFNMWDPTTQQTHKTRDVIFLNCMYFSPSPNIQAGEGVNSSFGNSLHLWQAQMMRMMRMMYKHYQTVMMTIQ
jgi:hypothetical protein